MRILYLSPNFPPNYWQFPVYLKDFGAEVVGLGWTSREQLRREVADALTDYVHVPDMGDYAAAHRAAALLISRGGRLDRVVSQEEHWIDLEAELRLDFNVPGLKPADIKGFRRKSLMKEVFREAGVPVAQGELASTPAAAKAFAKKVSYPLIAKSDKGVGANATFKLSNDAGIDRFFAEMDPAVPYILEEFLDGAIQSFDGLTGPNGEIVFSACHQFGTDIMTAVNNDLHLHYWSMRELPKDLEQLGRTSIAAFGLKERFFHLEFIRSPKGTLTAMELNARAPGGLTTDMFNFANDFNVYREWANLMVHGKFEAKGDRPYHVSYIGRKDTCRYAHSHEEVLSRHAPAILMHTPIDSVFRKAIGDYAYLARAKSMDRLWPVVNYVHELQGKD